MSVRGNSIPTKVRLFADLMYDRKLTDDEVYQNFQAFRGRYDI